jgi:hypothetical protein
LTDFLFDIGFDVDFIERAKVDNVTEDEVNKVCNFFDLAKDDLYNLSESIKTSDTKFDSNTLVTFATIVDSLLNLTEDNKLYWLRFDSDRYKLDLEDIKTKDTAYLKYINRNEINHNGIENLTSYYIIIKNNLYIVGKQSNDLYILCIICDNKLYVSSYKQLELERIFILAGLGMEVI